MKETVPAKPVLAIVMASVPVLPLVTVSVDAAGVRAMLPEVTVAVLATVRVMVAVPALYAESPEYEAITVCVQVVVVVLVQAGTVYV